MITVKEDKVIISLPLNKNSKVQSSDFVPVEKQVRDIIAKSSKVKPTPVKEEEPVKEPVKDKPKAKKSKEEK